MAQKFSYPVKRSPKSDPQQYRVYRMENEAIGARRYHRMTPEVQRGLAAGICRNYRVPQVHLEWADLGKWAAEWGSTPRTIRLSTRKGTSQDLLTLTHELAHHVHHWLSGGAANKQESHGPEFVGVHMSILDTCRVIPVVGMRAVCAAWKVRYADPGTRSSLKQLRRVAQGRA
jgi:hypothetical protein